MSQYSSQEILDLVPGTKALTDQVEILRETIESSPEDISPEAKITAAAIFKVLKPESSRIFEEAIDYLSDLNKQIEDHRGEAAVWFTSHKTLSRHRSIGPNDYTTVHSLNIGFLAAAATLELDTGGDIEISVANTKSAEVYGVEFEKGEGATPDFDNLILGDLKPNNSWGSDKITLPFAVEDIKRFPLLIGNEEVAKMINKSDIHDRDNRIILREALQ